ncbi:hypothetical protein NL676_015180 [Syzygium grande]|nr:hypothetical protein NL676_015180 [Syzygium grande]
MFPFKRQMTDPVGSNLNGFKLVPSSKSRGLDGSKASGSGLIDYPTVGNPAKKVTIPSYWLLDEPRIGTALLGSRPSSSQAQAWRASGEANVLPLPILCPASFRSGPGTAGDQCMPGWARPIYFRAKHGQLSVSARLPGPRSCDGWAHIPSIADQPTSSSPASSPCLCRSRSDLQAQLRPSSRRP